MLKKILISLSAALFLILPISASAISSEETAAPQPPVPAVIYATGKIVEATPPQSTPDGWGGEDITQIVKIEVLNGDFKGEIIPAVKYQISSAYGQVPILKANSRVILNLTNFEVSGQAVIEDITRATPLWALFAIFLVLVIAVSGFGGLKSFLGLIISLLMIVFLYIPQVLAGYSPMLLSFIYGTLIMIIALLIAHGVTRKTLAAFLGTIITLFGTIILAKVFVDWSSLTGLVDEEVRFLYLEGLNFNYQGLLIGAMILGALGVLDDVTVSQSSIVFELDAANPKFTFKELFVRSLNVGRDHIVSTVNTLALAYLATSLPLLLLLHQGHINLAIFAQSEVIATEILRILIGSIGIVFSIPFTNYIACLFAKKDWLEKLPTGKGHMGCKH